MKLGGEFTGFTVGDQLLLKWRNRSGGCSESTRKVADEFRHRQHVHRRAGPVAFCRRFLDKISHVHIKDVSASLAASLRGKDTGIAISQCAIGDGVNAGNIRKCLEMLHAHGFNGVLSMECEGQGGPMIEKSLAWLRKTMKEIGISEEK